MPDKRSEDRIPQGGFLLSQVHQLTGRRFDQLLRERGLETLTAARGRIVFALMEDDGISQKELAVRTRLEKSGLALTLKELERDGLIRRQRDGKDQRWVNVFRTEAFEQLMEVFRQVSRQMNEEFYRNLDPPSITRFEDTLGQILRNLESSSNHSVEDP